MYLFWEPCLGWHICWLLQTRCVWPRTQQCQGGFLWDLRYFLVITHTVSFHFDFLWLGHVLKNTVTAEQRCKKIPLSSLHIPHASFQWTNLHSFCCIEVFSALSVPIYICGSFALTLSVFFCVFLSTTPLSLSSSYIKVREKSGIVWVDLNRT